MGTYRHRCRCAYSYFIHLILLLGVHQPDDIASTQAPIHHSERHNNTLHHIVMHLTNQFTFPIFKTAQGSQQPTVLSISAKCLLIQLLSTHIKPVSHISNLSQIMWKVLAPCSIVTASLLGCDLATTFEFCQAQVHKTGATQAECFAAFLQVMTELSMLSDCAPCDVCTL